MHQQIRTSPGSTADNLRRALEILEGVNVEGIGPDFEPPHVRIAVRHENCQEALGALERAGLKPELRAAITFALPNAPGQLRIALDRLVDRGYVLESVLVLAGRDGDRTLVSVGVDRPMTDDWAASAESLGGLVDPKPGCSERGA
jgi:hypothetical protein